MRDKEETRRKILRAVRDLLEEDIAEIGVNRIADRAGIDKVLIYRYFGGLSGLLAAYAREGQVWPEFEEIMETAPSVAAMLPPAEIGARFVPGLLRELRDRAATLEILRWGLVRANDLTRETAAVREQRLQELVECHPEAVRDDAAALYALVTAGLIHLLLQTKSGEPFCTVDLHDPGVWNRIASAATNTLAGGPGPLS